MAVVRTPLLAVAVALLAAMPVAARAGPAHRTGSLADYRRCVAARSVLYPHLLAGRDERLVGATLDCLRHRGDAMKTVVSAPTPVPRILRSHIVTHTVSRWLHGRHRD